MIVVGGEWIAMDMDMGGGGGGVCFVVCLRFVCLFGSILFVFVIFF